MFYNHYSSKNCCERENIWYMLANKAFFMQACDVMGKNQAQMEGGGDKKRKKIYKSMYIYVICGNKGH